MLIRILIGLITTGLYGYAMVILVPAIVSGALTSSVPLLAVGAVTFMYGFAMMLLFNKKYREEMNGPDAQAAPSSPPDQAA